MLSALLQIKDIPGECQEPDYKGWLEITGWDFGQSQSGSSAFGSGSGSGKVSMRDFQFQKNFDSSSPKLFFVCATGEHVESATLLVRRTGFKSGLLEEYYRIEFSNLIISAYQTSGSAGDSGLPSESISFNFASHRTTFQLQAGGAAAGAMMATYDVKTGDAT